jgi:2-polyprenyl-6-methoxyphenol hydroxylase-like FAD-dependent oxidoreductase
MKNIAIIGAGPGGLTLARLLQLKGVNVHVYERDVDQHARVQGAIVDLHFDSGLKVMEAAGLTEEFKAAYMPGADKYRLVDQHAHIISEDKGTSEARFGDESFRPEIDRGALRNLLIDALLPGTVIWNSHFVSMEQVNGSWIIQFENGTTATADLVVGADGYRSKIRPYVTDVKALYSGSTIIQGEIEHPEKACAGFNTLMNNANLIAMGAGKTIAAQPRGDGGLTFYAASLYPEDWIKTSGINFNNAAEVSAYLAGFYEGWDPVYHELFKACTHWVPRPLNYFPLDQQWETKANVTLIGDAAHLMPPSGEGVNTAMLDALDLSESLSTEGIAAYEKKMLARAKVLGEEALEGIQGFSSPSDASIREMIELLS